MTSSDGDLVITGDGWNDFLALTAGLDHGVVRDLAVQFGSYVDKEQRAHLDESCRASVLLHLQEDPPAAWILLFTDVREIAIDIQRDAVPTRQQLDAYYQFEFLSLHVLARLGSAKPLGPSALGPDASLASLELRAE
jgi:hypothetical protein